MFTLSLLPKHGAVAISLMTSSSVWLEYGGLRVFGHHNVLVMFLAVQDLVGLSVVFEIERHLALRTLEAEFVEFYSTSFHLLLRVNGLLADTAFVTTTEFRRHF